ncbi:VOC family protein [Flavobacterium sp. K5-23]|uniref:VOC family protein n=1 Tax=Flavobacterium sp. K5-23 TaxID=2746225 RepID=UPI00200F76D5|nr:VOC family protein [Flavobacterium sp. K5-23]UQD56365.1 VOC family protein [Flavobacterium sp. K5-23]
MTILKIELLTNNINATSEFYQEVLGLKMIAINETSVSFQAGSTTLRFVLSKIENPIYHFAFDIPNNQLLEAFGAIEKYTEILEVIPPDKIADFYNWNAKSFYFFDNNGNVLELICRYNLDNKSEEPFSGSSIISISEIGFVSKNVSQLCDELVAKYDVPVFSMQPKLEKFIVLGTEIGLFILAAEGKDWYPTNIKAKSFWSKVTFEIDNVLSVFET